MTGLAPEPVDRAIARILAGGLPARIEIDYNQRDHNGHTPARFDHCDRIPELGETVTVHQPEDGTEGDATVAGIDEDRGIVRLDVDWASLRDS